MLLLLLLLRLLLCNHNTTKLIHSRDVTEQTRQLILGGGELFLGRFLLQAQLYAMCDVTAAHNDVVGDAVAAVSADRTRPLTMYIKRPPVYTHGLLILTTSTYT